MSTLRKWWIVFRHPAANIRFGDNVYVGPRFSLFIPGGGSFVVGDGVEFRRDFHAEISGTGRVTIGSGSVFTYAVLIQVTTQLDIGERCVFAQGVNIVDGQHRFRDLKRPMNDQGFDLHPVQIRDDAFIASKCTIMADVGRRTVVGANAVVTRPLPDFTVCVGAPARPIDYFGPPESDPNRQP